MVTVHTGTDDVLPPVLPLLGLRGYMLPRGKLLPLPTVGTGILPQVVLIVLGYRHPPPYGDNLNPRDLKPN